MLLAIISKIHIIIFDFSHNIINALYNDIKNVVKLFQSDIRCIKTYFYFRNSKDKTLFQKNWYNKLQWMY